jgi:hypothetical protein
MGRNVRNVVVTLAIALMIASSFVFTAFGQAASPASLASFGRISADQRYINCGHDCDPNVAAVLAARAVHNNARVAENANAALTDAIPGLGMLISGGSVITTPTGAVYFYGGEGGYPNPVFVEGRKFTVTEDGKTAQYGPAVYANKDFIFDGRFGPGYFPYIAPYALIPIAEFDSGDPGEGINVQVTIYDVGTGRPVESEQTTSWSQVRGTISGAPNITGVSITGGNLITLNGTFPPGALALSVGNPRWDSRILPVWSTGTQITFTLPRENWGGYVYPSGWAAQELWSFYLKTWGGETFSFPNVALVQGNSTDFGVELAK